MTDRATVGECRCQRSWPSLYVTVDGIRYEAHAAARGGPTSTMFMLAVRAATSVTQGPGG